MGPEKGVSFMGYDPNDKVTPTMSSQHGRSYRFKARKRRHLELDRRSRWATPRHVRVIHQAVSKPSTRSSSRCRNGAGFSVVKKRQLIR